jgi:multiple sugar transport system substrate-binding protein
LRYALWDANQLPAYQQCADDFMALYPNITIQIEQTDWPDYWTKMYREMEAGAGPDVLTNHLSRLPELAQQGWVLDLEPLVQRDKVDTEIYIGRLARLWTRAGQRYGLPKDWDTIALVVNLDHLQEAGVTLEELNQATWNPEDGGTFQQILARLTKDSLGRSALSVSFDPKDVVQYGMTLPEQDLGGAYGQQQWSHFAASTGFRFTDYQYAAGYHYDDPRLIATLDWLARLINQEGYITPFEQMASSGGESLFLEGKAAIAPAGSWRISTYAEAPFDIAFARLPLGPLGRKSILNGLADSIWTGTPHPEEAWAWVQYLSSVPCQLRVGEAGVVFPAILSGTERALAAYADRGLDVSPYLAQALDPSDIILFPVTENASAVARIVTPAIQSILAGDARAEELLPQVNERVNALFD